jgi:hypothetical protein
MKNLIIIIFISFIAHSCVSETENKNLSKISNTQTNQFLINGQLDSLINSEDTLILYLNLSGCIDRRYDKIRFYRISNTIFIRPEIKLAFGEEEIIQGKEKKYSLLKNDTLSFEYFISHIHRTLSEEPDSLKGKSGFISIGVSPKWGKTYFSERMTSEQSRIYRLYIRIMHEIFPEMEEYRPIQIIEIIEDNSLNSLLEQEL